ncbi:hypothetical protein HPB50_016672 [Hyalomma asiaticum]|uniref:Uncharacterized protein n=1 Tax=Hyalomma asiaticum TaxID=266040 RepID=A0ACB7RK88_HYAAI|nr:hypothetical protein HPB50_016672 [Hyalomma asiaticum]
MQLCRTSAWKHTARAYCLDATHAPPRGNETAHATDREITHAARCTEGEQARLSSLNQREVEDDAVHTKFSDIAAHHRLGEDAKPPQHSVRRTRSSGEDYKPLLSSTARVSTRCTFPATPARASFVKSPAPSTTWRGRVRRRHLS